MALDQTLRTVQCPSPALHIDPRAVPSRHVCSLARPQCLCGCCSPGPAGRPAHLHCPGLSGVPPSRPTTAHSQGGCQSDPVETHIVSRCSCVQTPPPIEMKPKGGPACSGPQPPPCFHCSPLCPLVILSLLRWHPCCSSSQACSHLRILAHAG